MHLGLWMSRYRLRHQNPTQGEELGWRLLQPDGIGRGEAKTPRQMRTITMRLLMMKILKRPWYRRYHGHWDAAGQYEDDMIAPIGNLYQDMETSHIQEEADLVARYRQCPGSIWRVIRSSLHQPGNGAGYGIGKHVHVWCRTWHYSWVEWKEVKITIKIWSGLFLFFIKIKCGVH